MHLSKNHLGRIARSRSRTNQARVPICDFSEPSRRGDLPRKRLLGPAYSVLRQPCQSFLAGLKRGKFAAGETSLQREYASQRWRRRGVSPRLAGPPRCLVLGWRSVCWAARTAAPLVTLCPRIATG